MNQVVVALAATSPFVAGLVWALWWLVTDALRERRHRRAAVRFARHYHAGRDAIGKHSYPAHATADDEDLFVTVPALVARAIAYGDGLRLHWPDADQDAAGLVRPYVQDQFPTAVLPRLAEWG